MTGESTVETLERLKVIVVVVVVDLHYCLSSERLQSEYNCIIVTPDMCVS